MRQGADGSVPVRATPATPTDDRARRYWERNARRYYAHDQTLLSGLVSRTLGALARFPGRRRFTAASLRAAVERCGFEVAAAEVIPGLVPIAFVAAVRR